MDGALLYHGGIDDMALAFWDGMVGEWYTCCGRLALHGMGVGVMHFDTQPDLKIIPVEMLRLK